ncbi:hypothetical protein LO762_28650 [Actinocorallia sp. API 0066]|uniref:hypothetical protein n=1 Tax=Actinocorallia sp. API 0066 TaxID=2896846 RepID=UPI001E4C54B2|nr:hypothetical protein [Actinocorallia sp. API 0066]MCD0453122.1 hypothetical protein [Actinocorallia sp. API 0066]
MTTPNPPGTRPARPGPDGVPDTRLGTTPGAAPSGSGAARGVGVGSAALGAAEAGFTPEAGATVRAGTVAMGGGLVLLGVSASVYLVVAGRAVEGEAFGALSVLWTLVYTMGIGAFLPFEQELGRAFAGRRARGVGTGPLVARVAVAAGAVLGVVLLLGLLGGVVLGDVLFGGSWVHIGVFGVVMGVMAVGYVTRGIFAGAGRFQWYSRQLGVEGAVRIVVCGGLLAAGVAAAWPYLWLLALAPLAALVVTLPGARGAFAPGPPAAWSELSVNLGWLLLAGVAAQAVAHAPTVAVQLLTGADGTAGRFLAAFVVVRVPLFLFQGVQAVLLPGLAGALAVGDGRLFAARLRGVLAATAGVAALGVAGAAVAGPAALGLLFGAGFDLGRGHLVVLAVATGLSMVAQVFQAGLVALGGHRANALGWAGAAAVFALVCLVPGDPLVRVETALVLSCLAATLWLAVALRRLARHHPARTRSALPS